MSRSGRGVLYMVWGTKTDAPLQRSLASVREHHPELPVHVVRLPEQATLLEKARMFELSPFAETVFLDADTVVLDRLDFGFAKAAEWGLACCICECPWARRYGGISGEMVEYNTGVLFFGGTAAPVFERWRHHAARIDSSILQEVDGRRAVMPLNDQAGFAVAVEEIGFPLFVLPSNWNFRPRWQFSWFGPLKVWHDYGPVPDGLRQANREQAASDSLIRFAVLRR